QAIRAELTAAPPRSAANRPTSTTRTTTTTTAATRPVIVPQASQTIESFDCDVELAEIGEAIHNAATRFVSLKSRIHAIEITNPRAANILLEAYSAGLNELDAYRKIQRWNQLACFTLWIPLYGRLFMEMTGAYKQNKERMDGLYKLITVNFKRFTDDLENNIVNVEQGGEARTVVSGEDRSTLIWSKAQAVQDFFLRFYDQLPDWLQRKY